MRVKQLGVAARGVTNGLQASQAVQEIRFDVCLDSWNQAGLGDEVGRTADAARRVV